MRRRRGRTVALVLALLAACSPPPTDDPAAPDPTPWPARVQASADRTTLAGGAVALPDGARVLAARIFPGGDVGAYAWFEAGGGGFDNNFFPASAVKLLAALGALDFARSLGFTGDAVVDGGYSLREYYDAALRWSSNEDYSALVRIAGVDRLNRQFLPDHGFGGTAIQEPYGAGEQVTFSPEMTLTEGDREVVVPERQGDEDYGCDGGNCATLFDLAEAIRRVALDSELPGAERFDLDPADIAGLQDALAGAEGFIAPGVVDALGPDVRIFTKPGWVPELECVEAALVVDDATGHRFLVAVSAPDDGTCEELATMASEVLRVIDQCEYGTALRSDGRWVGIAGGRQTGSPRLDGPATVDCESH
jgi:hypothetical protein